MAIRIASTLADATLIKGLIDSFFTSLGVSYSPRPATRYQAGFSATGQVWIVDTTRNIAALVSVNSITRELKIESLLPRGVSKALLKPPLHLGLTTALARFPTAGVWRVWAEFYRGVGANGVPDGGKSECDAWKLEFSGATVRQIDGRWIIEWTLGSAAVA